MLLLLHAFIAMPIQFWHHHNYKVSVKKINQNSSNKTPTFTEFSNNSTEDNCQVCSQRYTEYSEDSIVINTITPTFQLSRASYFTIPIPSAPNNYLPNKGPPTIS